MRQGELFGLQWPEINFDAGSVFVQRSLEEINGHLRLKETKTGRRRRRIELAPFTLDVRGACRPLFLLDRFHPGGDSNEHPAQSFDPPPE
jgi:integrase